MSSAIWKAIPSASPNSPEVPVAAAAEQAGGLEQLPGLERAAGEIVLDARVRVVGLRALQRLAAGEGERRAGEALHGRAVAGRSELGEGPREQVVAGRARGLGAVARPGRLAAAPVVSLVDQVVVDERRHVHELDRRAGRERRLAWTGGEEDEQRPQPLAAGRERFAADLGDEPRVRVDRRGQAHLEVLEVGVEAGRLADRREAHFGDPDVQRNDPARERAPADVLEAGSAQEAGELVGAGKTAHAGGKVRVRGAAGKDLAEQRHEAVEPEPVERREQPAAAS